MRFPDVSATVAAETKQNKTRSPPSSTPQKKPAPKQHCLSCSAICHPGRARWAHLVWPRAVSAEVAPLGTGGSPFQMLPRARKLAMAGGQELSQGRGQALSVGCLGFSTTWGWDSESKHPKRARQKGTEFL